MTDGPAHPFAGVSLGFIKVPVRDFAKAAAFYRETLGLTEDFAVEEYGWGQYQLGDAVLCLYVPGMGGGDGEPGRDTGLQLRVTNAREAFAHLQAAGATVGELQIGDDGTLSFVARDPDGNRFSVAQVG